jgi:hypothetical protein
MCAAAFDFVAERGFIAASDDPNQLFDWMSDYDQRRRDARAEGDDHEAAQFEELRQEAEDRVVELKSARLRRVAPRSAAPATVVQPAAEPPTRREVERPAAHTSVRGTPAATVEPLAVARAQRSRRREAEEAAARKAAEEAEAAAERAANEELRQLQERAANAKARREAALAVTARIEAQTKRAAAEAAREQARRQAAKEAEDAERAAAEAEAAARSAATSAAKGPPAPPVGPAMARIIERPGPKADEATPLALLFQERLIEVMETPTATLPAPRPSIAPPAAREASPALSPPVAVPPTPVNVPAPPPNPVDDLPALTGADLAAYRAWLGASQRALGAKLAVEQSVISKSEGKPTTVLPPQLRKALHLAMQEPRDAAKGAS